MFTKEITLLVVFAAPLFMLLFTSCFKLDELMAKPKMKKRYTRRRTFRPRLPGIDAQGMPKCMDPDGRWYGPASKAA